LHNYHLSLTTYQFNFITFATIKTRSTDVFRITCRTKELKEEEENNSINSK